MMAGIGIALMAVMMAGMMLFGHRHGRKAHRHAAEPETAVCPVSGNTLTISSATARATVGGTVYYFDDEKHLREFALELERFLSKP